MISFNNNSVATKTRYSLLKVMTGSDLSRRRLPFMSISAAEPGPIVWLTACMHGDEVGGMVVIQEVFKAVKYRLLRGVINAFPLMNPIGFETASRTIYPSREDLNRSFPGNGDGSLGERIAGQIFNSIMNTRPDLLVDLHSDWRQSIPYTLLDKKRTASASPTYSKLRDLCESTGFYMVEDNALIEQSLTHTLLEQHIPAITIELGESYVVNEKNIEFGISAILNLLSRLDMVIQTDTKNRFQKHPAAGASNLLTYSEQPRCTKSGIIRFLAKPGDLLEAGQPVMKVYNAFGKLQETLRAVHPSIVLGNADTAVAYPGMSAMAFGVL